METVPQIFVKGTFVGGCNDGTEKWHGIRNVVSTGKLDSLYKIQLNSVYSNNYKLKGNLVMEVCIKRERYSHFQVNLSLTVQSISIGKRGDSRVLQEQVSEGCILIDKTTHEWFQLRESPLTSLLKELMNTLLRIWA